MSGVSHSFLSFSTEERQVITAIPCTEEKQATVAQHKHLFQCTAGCSIGWGRGWVKHTTLFPRSLPFCEHFICLFFFYNMIIFCLFFVVAPWFFLIHRLIWLPYIVSINIMTYLTVKFSVQYAVPSYVSSTYLFPYFSKIAMGVPLGT